VNRRILLLVGAVVVALAAVFLLYRRSVRTEAPGNIIIQAIRNDTVPMSRNARGPKSRTAPPLDPARLPELVRDTSWEVRLDAAAMVLETRELPQPRRAELLLDALGQEISTPASAPPLTGSYLPRTGVHRLHYVHLIEDLGPAAAGPARNAMQKESGARREWATIALGAAGGRDAAPALRQLLRSSSEAAVRMSAAYFLGRLSDRSAIDDLRAALGDSATARIMSDDTGTRGRTLYPVREQAAGALMVLGVKVERNGNTFTSN
jgi:HEAT repeat protein